jgi:hypothetical protein
VGLSLTVEKVTAPSTDAALPSASSRWGERGPEAAIAVLFGGVAAFFFAWASLGLVRDTLHFNCSWGIGGEWGSDGTWMCADGIGYVGVAVVLGGMSGVLVLAGLLTAVARPSAGRSIAYLVLGSVSLAWIGWWTFYAATAYTGLRPVGETGSGLWAATVLPGLALCALGLLVGAVSALMVPRRTPVVLWIGASMMLAGTLLQHGIGIATLVSAGMLVAAGVGRGPRPSRRATR